MQKYMYNKSKYWRLKILILEGDKMAEGSKSLTFESDKIEKWKRAYKECKKYKSKIKIFMLYLIHVILYMVISWMNIASKC